MGFDAVNGLAGRNAALDAVMLFAAGPLIYILFAAGGLALLLGMRGRDRVENLWLVGQVFAALLLGFVINRGLRLLAVHERPFQTREVIQLVEHDPGASFPSNHATAALTIALVIGVFGSAAWGLLLALPAMLVAVSRVYVGIHWPSDIIGGALVGLVAVTVIWWLGRWLQRRGLPHRGAGEGAGPGTGPGAGIREARPTTATGPGTPAAAAGSHATDQTVLLGRIEPNTVIIPAVVEEQTLNLPRIRRQ